MATLIELFNIETSSILFLVITITGLLLGYKKENVRKKKTGSLGFVVCKF